MKVAERIARRQVHWRELEKLCTEDQKTLRKNAEKLVRFSELYRSACADLALAESHQLPPQTIDYLHRLVAVAHNQLYRSTKYQWQNWFKILFEDTPRAIFCEPCIHFCFVVFWGLFLTSAYLAYENSAWPAFAAEVVGEETLEFVEESYRGFGGRDFTGNSTMTGFYILNNAGIGLSCFVSMLFLIPGFVTLSSNAVQLGAVFGYMFRPDLGDASIHFKTFVTAHGPLELTAIVISAGAGLKIGLSWLVTNGLSRADSLVKTARQALPIVMCAVVLFCMAALIEGFISPTPEKNMPWWVKGSVSAFTTLMLMFYFVILGYPREGNRL